MLLYNNAFVEEFFHRGIILAKFERAIGQGRAVFWGGILFGLTHAIFDLTVLIKSEGLIAVFLAMLMQTIAGWILGIIYIKNRSLWPGMACHYLGNWLPSILIRIFG